MENHIKEFIKEARATVEEFLEIGDGNFPAKKLTEACNLIDKLQAELANNRYLMEHGTAAFVKRLQAKLNKHRDWVKGRVIAGYMSQMYAAQTFNIPYKEVQKWVNDSEPTNK